ncbi:DUF2336 domain-containing protein [Phenylobacterium sp.]|uniref:DUF2336 domain-containing protein n=1 Tax=Phenylobacterium sp. TaxID=1871053 RepID=UPI002731CFEF|nr:DUF2336 domain-containing protein [Phenylobacterium sp.]MDP1616722.1 DUF2336 domain-containing protein [Phenylobacterium sp.]MDP1988890.1 DUF2336 domain-containing protein [Phenylobacterium sp.]
MSALARTEEILSLAKSRTPGDRERLLLAVVDLCDVADSGQIMSAPAVQDLLNSIFMSLVVEAERDIRKRLAEKLAGVDWAPIALINVLALDDIEIARPIIAASPILKDHDLVRLLVEATVEHQIEVARRPSLGAPVVAAILQQAEPAVLTALVGNTQTALAPDDMTMLVKASRRVAALRSPLTRRAELTEALARELYAWVGQALRQALGLRFRLDTTALDAALGQAVGEAHAGASAESGDAIVWQKDDEREEMEKRLISKLVAAGQLRPGYLLRALREGKLSLFVGVLSTLGDFPADMVRRAMDGDQPEHLALACAAVSIDRSAFPTILELVRSLNDNRPGGGAEGARRALAAFGPFAPDLAAAAFRQTMSSRQG